MTICVNDLGEGFITFPAFQQQLRAYERDRDARPAVVERQAPMNVPRFVFWVGHNGRGVCDDAGEPLLFESIADADSFIASKKMHGARVFRWATTR